MRIRHLILLVHPAAWQEYAQLNPEMIRDNNYGLFVEREKQCIDRWLAELPCDDESTLLIQLCGKKLYDDTIAHRLGERSVCYLNGTALLPALAKPDPGNEREGVVYQHQFHVNIVQHIRDHIERFDLEFDPATVTSEIWGESFEGCAPGYAGAIAHGLGLKKPPQMRFEMNVWDSRFLYQAKRWEAVPLQGTDVEAWLFELHDRSFAAIYQARLSEQWLDKRTIYVQLNPTRMFVCMKNGHTIWPSRHYEKNDKECQLPYALTTGWPYSHWIRAWRQSYEQFRQIVISATVGAAPTGYEDYVYGGDFWASDTTSDVKDVSHATVTG